MNPRLEKFFEQQKKNESAKRNLVLMRLGLCDENGEPIEVSDDEYKEIEKYVGKIGDSDKTGNVSSVSTILNVLACVIFIGGFILGMVLGIGNGYHGEWGLAFACWFITLVNGILMISIAKIIQLLQEIRDK